MKKGTKILCAAMTTALVTAGASAFIACSDPKPLTDEPLTGTVLADFSEGEADALFASDGWCNGDVFNVTWKADNVKYENGAMKLKITDATSGDVPYFGGEARTYQHFSYGDYSVTMKPAGVPGTASTFFTYTGPSETDENGNPNPHDEIDIEFVGKDTTKVQFNYFVNGVGGHEKMYDLGFDASKDFHEYGFRWTQDYIVWFVDGKPVYKGEATAKNPMPSTPSRILTNHWTGTSATNNWMGNYAGPSETGSEYKQIKTSATPIGEIPEKPEGPVIPDGEKVALNFSSTDVYTVDKSGEDAKQINVTYTAAAGASYGNIQADVVSLAANNDVFSLKIKNNADHASTVRVDLIGEQSTGNTDVCNLSAACTGGTGLRTDTEWGGTYITLAAGEEVTLVISYTGTSDKGAVQRVQLYPDSATYGDTETHAGDLTFSEFIFGKADAQ